MAEAEGCRHTGEGRYPESESNRRLDPGLRRGDELEPQWPDMETLRASGTAERDPVRFAYLEAMARRAATQPEAVRALLEAKIHKAVRELARPPADASTGTSDGGASSPLADLLAHISQHANAQAEAEAEATGLRSITRFHETWARMSSEQQLTQTLAQAPENAGPMNSQHLVLRSLQRMRDIAPDYLQAFMSYVDTLIWLEQADPTRSTTGRASTGERESKAQTAKRGTTSR